MPLLGFFRRDSRIFALNYVERILFSMCFKVEMRSFRLNYVKLTSLKRYFGVSVAFCCSKKMLFGRKVLPLHRFLDYCACSIYKIQVQNLECAYTN